MISSCKKEIDTSISNFSRIEIPNADIVYNSISIDNKEHHIDVIGFYSLQNKKTETVDFDWNTILPYYINPNELIVINKKGYPGDYMDSLGHLMILRDNQIARCSSPQTFGDYVKPYNGKALISSLEGIYLINPVDCTVEKTVLSIKDVQDVFTGQFGTFDLSGSGNLLIFSNGSLPISKLMLKDLSTGEMTDLHLNGANPSFSPNEESVAYLGSDGIYLIDINGTSSKLLVPLGETMDGSYMSRGNPSKPNWSPDGAKLVYHKCSSKSLNCGAIEDYDIYVYDIETNQEELIIHGGLNPSWNYFKE